jgi:hypothetical protein
MRKTVLALSVAASAAALSTSASAQPPNWGANPTGLAVGAAAVTGTVVGLGFAEGWWAGPASLGTAAGGAAVGGVAFMGTLALLHSITTPCTGFRIAIDPPEACAGFAGPAPVAARPAPRRLRN